MSNLDEYFKRRDANNTGKVDFNQALETLAEGARGNDDGLQSNTEEYQSSNGYNNLPSNDSTFYNHGRRPDDSSSLINPNLNEGINENETSSHGQNGGE